MSRGQNAKGGDTGRFLTKDAGPKVAELKARVSEKVSFVIRPTSFGAQGKDNGSSGCICIGHGQRVFGLIDIKGQSANVLRQFREGFCEVRMVTNFGEEGTEGLLDASNEAATPLVGRPVQLSNPRIESNIKCITLESSIVTES